MPHKSKEPSPAGWRARLPLLLIMPGIAAVLSGVITWINIGASPEFVWHWGRAFLMAMCVMPVGLYVMTLVRRRLAQPLAVWPPVLGKVLLGLMTACLMEFLISAVVTLGNQGLGAGWWQAWARAFVGSLPVGICIGMTMAFVVHPRLARLGAQRV